MKNLRVTSDVVPVAQFRGQTKRFLARLVETDQPLLLTQNGKPAAVMLSPAEYDRYVEHEQERFAAAVRAGLADVKAGRVVGEQDALRRLGLGAARKPRAKRSK